MKNLTFTGIDANLEISLFEYGLIVSNEQHEDGSGTHFCVYMIDKDNFGTGHVSEAEINNLLSGKEWASHVDIDGLLDYVGNNLDAELESSLVNKLFDLMQYFGYENIFGMDYSPISRKEAEHLYF